MKTLKGLLATAFIFGAGSIGLATPANAVIGVGEDVVIVICVSDGSTTVCNSTAIDL